MSSCLKLQYKEQIEEVARLGRKRRKIGELFIGREVLYKAIKATRNVVSSL